MTGGVVYLLDADEATLNRQYVRSAPLGPEDETLVRSLLMEHVAETSSPVAEGLIASFDPSRFARISTGLSPEPLE
jgi:glutamate synthase (NADPH/NADH) large chain